MNPKAVGLIVLGVIVVVCLLVWLTVWWLGRQAGVRRSAYNEMKERLNQEIALFSLATNALDDLLCESDSYRDFQDPNSILAMKIRERIRQYNDDKRELKQR